MSYWNNGTGSNIVENLGHSGRFHSGIKIAAGATLELTGSNYGMGAVFLGAGANVAATKIHLQGGGIVDGDDLLQFTVYEFGVNKVVANTGDVYVLKTNQI